ncbi:MAG: substrate-binding domain-containing protein [Victivallaceae bacterium]|nr:substrate-binding domain-containing protein [Victivallaceae bacterium]
MSQSKKNLVIEYLIGELAKLSAGEKLPSNLKLQHLCKVSQSVVTRAVDDLVNLGLIEVRPKSGFYKKEQARKNIHIVYLRKNDQSIMEPNSFYNNHLSAIFNALSVNGYGVSFYHLDNLMKLPFVARRIEEGGTLLGNEMVITFSMPASELPAVRELEARGVRFVHWLPDFTDPCPNAITIDEYNLVSEEVRFLVGKGHRRIAFAHRCVKDTWSRSANARYNEFCHQNICCRLQTLPEYLFYLDSRFMKQEECNAALRKVFSVDPKPTAIIMTDVDAKMLYDSLETLKIRPGRDVAVLGTNNQYWCKYMTPRLSGVGFDLKAGVAHLLSIVRSGQLQWNFPAWNFPIVIEDRESTPALGA